MMPDTLNQAIPVSRLASPAFRLTLFSGRKSVIPGFGLAMGITLLALGLIVLIPLTALVLKSATIGPAGFWNFATSPRILASLRLSFGAAFVGAVVNAFFGTLVAWVLVRYEFPGRRIVDAIVDLPFALPTAVAGIALSALYAESGWIGGLLAPLGIKVAYTPLGVAVALTFVGLPFVVRTVQPVLEEASRDVEEAAALLGAGRLRTVLTIVIPTILPAIITGFALAFARAIGEYGSVIFIAGNLPMISEIAPLLIVIRLEQFDYVGATIVATAMLALSFAALFGINALVAWHQKRFERG
jgi:sulfate transport system permease protein